MTENAKTESLIIIGAGPAGLSAALYAARAELSPLVLTGMQLGGQAALTNDIENYPGFPDGIGGAALGDLFQKQAERFGARVEYDSVLSVDLQTRPFTVLTYGKKYLAKAIIIATGAKPVYLGVPREKELTGQGVSYCATCDGWFFKEKEVVVVGGGDSALEEAIFLTKFASKVTIIHRRDAFRAGAILQTRAKSNPKIVFLMDSIVKEIKGDGKVDAVMVENVKTGKLREYKTDGVFVFIGHTPNTDMFRQYLELDQQGYIKVNMKMETNIEGVFACGESADPDYKQVVTSAGMGAAAAIQANRYLEKLEEQE
jgi:thioredoxin reductase (NADPH)